MQISWQPSSPWHPLETLYSQYLLPCLYCGVRDQNTTRWYTGQHHFLQYLYMNNSLTITWRHTTIERGELSIINKKVHSSVAENGHWSIGIRLEIIRRKLYSLTSVSSNKIVIPVRSGFLDVKTNSRNMCSRIFEIK